MIRKDSTRDGPGIYRHNILRSKSYAGWIMRMDSGHHAERLGLLEFPNEETPLRAEAMMLRLCRLHDRGDADLPQPAGDETFVRSTVGDQDNWSIPTR